MQKLCKVYEVTSGGEVIARGFASDVAMVLGCQQQNVITLGRSSGVYKGKYRVTIIGQKIKRYDKNGNVLGTSGILPDEETFVERYQDLDSHGNTIMSKDEYKRRKELIEDKGYNVKYTKIKHGRQKMYYLVEVL